MPRIEMMKVIIVKELREALRHKQMKQILLVGVLWPLVYSLIYGKMDTKEHAERSHAVAVVAQAPERTETPPSTPPAASLLTMIMSVGFGFFMAAIYAVTLSVETFAGEKERKTVEVLLAAPCSAVELFAGKVAGSALTAIALGIGFGIVGFLGFGIAAAAYGLAIPWRALGWTVGYSFVLLVGGAVMLSAFGALISSRATTIRGALQVFGMAMAVFFLVVFLVFFWLIDLESAQWIKTFFEWIACSPHPVNFVVILLAFVAVNWVLLSFSAAAFDRERILTGM
jgi:ABC-type Na+ efflux pump permease subunit